MIAVLIFLFVTVCSNTQDLLLHTFLVVLLTYKKYQDELDRIKNSAFQASIVKLANCATGRDTR
jgi:hypothetical protein